MHTHKQAHTHRGTWLIRRHLPQAQTQLQQHRQHARQNRSARCKKKLEANFIKYSWPRHKRQQQQQQHHEQCTRRRSSEERRKKYTKMQWLHKVGRRKVKGGGREGEDTHASHVAACTFLTCLQLVCVCAAQSRGSFPLLSGKIVSVSLGAAAATTTTASTVAAATDKLSFNHLAVYSIFFVSLLSYLCCLSLSRSLPTVVSLFCAVPPKFKACNVCWLDIEILIDERALYVYNKRQ